MIGRLHNGVEQQNTLAANLQKTLAEVKYFFLKKTLVESQYHQCITSAREYANTLDSSNLDPLFICLVVKIFLEKNCPELKIIHDELSNDLYVEVISRQTRVYFNWKNRTD